MTRAALAYSCAFQLIWFFSAFGNRQTECRAQRSTVHAIRAAAAARQLQRRTRAPRPGQCLGDLRVERDVVVPARRQPLGPADRSRRTRAHGAEAEHRRQRHALDQRARPFVLTGRTGMPVQRRDGVQQQHVGVRARGGALLARHVHAAGCVPLDPQPGRDAVGEREVVLIGERAGGRGRQEQPGRERDQSRAHAHARDHRGRSGRPSWIGLKAGSRRRPFPAWVRRAPAGARPRRATARSRSGPRRPPAWRRP